MRHLWATSMLHSVSLGAFNFLDFNKNISSAPSCTSTSGCLAIITLAKPCKPCICWKPPQAWGVLLHPHNPHSTPGLSEPLWSGCLRQFLLRLQVYPSAKRAWNTRTGFLCAIGSFASSLFLNEAVHLWSVYTCTHTRKLSFLEYPMFGWNLGAKAWGNYFI